MPAFCRLARASWASVRLDVQRDHALRPVGQQRGHVARAGADFQHLFVLLHLQLLQHACFHARRQHAFAFGQGQLHVHEGQRLVGQRHEVFALDDRQQGQHFRVEHVPGADLLLDHVEAGLFQGGEHGHFMGVLQVQDQDKP
jgi:hypothetical protein